MADIIEISDLDDAKIITLDKIENSTDENFELKNDKLNSKIICTADKILSDSENIFDICDMNSLPFALSMSGCGFLGVYHFGSVVCLRRHGLNFLTKCDRIAGTSAGSLVAAVLVTCPEKIQASLTAWYALASEVIGKPLGALSPNYSLMARVQKYVDDFLPPDAHEIASGRLHISVTCRSDGKNYIVSKFPSRESLVKYLLSSCYIPFYAGSQFAPPVIDGLEYIDGGLTTNLPIFVDRRTVTISPFSGEADICPEDGYTMFDWTMTLSNQTLKLNVHNMKRGMQALFPPSLQVLEQYYTLGYLDTMKFLMKTNCFERLEGTEV